MKASEVIEKLKELALIAESKDVNIVSEINVADQHGNLLKSIGTGFNLYQLDSGDNNYTLSPVIVMRFDE